MPCPVANSEEESICRKKGVTTGVKSIRKAVIYIEAVFSSFAISLLLVCQDVRTAIE